MKSTQEFIIQFDELPPEEQQVIIDYVVSKKDATLKSTHLSPEDMAVIDQRDEETQIGINVEIFSSMSEARKSLTMQGTIERSVFRLTA